MDKFNEVVENELISSMRLDQIFYGYKIENSICASYLAT